MSSIEMIILGLQVNLCGNYFCIFAVTKNKHDPRI